MLKLKILNKWKVPANVRTLTIACNGCSRKRKQFGWPTKWEIECQMQLGLSFCLRLNANNLFLSNLCFYCTLSELTGNTKCMMFFEYLPFFLICLILKCLENTLLRSKLELFGKRPYLFSSIQSVVLDQRNIRNLCVSIKVQDKVWTPSGFWGFQNA